MTDLNTSRGSDPAFRRWVDELATRHGFEPADAPDEAPKAERLPANERWNDASGRTPRWEGKEPQHGRP